MKILWLCNEEGWAFDNASKLLASRMPQNQHDFGYYKTGQVAAKMNQADAVICHHPAVVSFIGDKPVLLRLASRAKKELFYRILWFCDKPGWAYENVCKALADKLPNYCHEFLFKDRESLEEASRKVKRADIIICNNSEVLNWFSGEIRQKKLLLRFATGRIKPPADIIWLCDMRGWAYDQRARALAEKLKDYSHHFVYYWDYETDEQRKAAVEQCNIVVCMCLAYVPLVRTIKKALMCVGGYRLLGIEGSTVN